MYVYYIDMIKKLFFGGPKQSHSTGQLHAFIIGVESWKLLKNKRKVVTKASTKSIFLLIDRLYCFAAIEKFVV